MSACPRCREPKNENSPTCLVCGYKFTGVFNTCPAGVHVMDPSWTECAYCTPSKPGRLPTVAEGGMQGRSGHTPTKLEGDEPPPPAPSKPMPQPVVPVAPIPQPPIQQPRPPAPIYDVARPATPPAGVRPPDAVSGVPRVHKKTEFGFMPEAGQSAAGQAAGYTPAPVPQPGMGLGKIVGMLITYSWNPEGQMFPVRQGRNVIGRDEECEIAFPQDGTLSMKNTWIMYQGEFMIGDHLSKSGTEVNGKPVGPSEKPLPNYARIRTGSTHWIFVEIEPKPSE